MEVTGYTTKLVAAFAAIYLIWGSTYLAIRYAIETLPPLLMAGTRFVAAGLPLYAWARLRGAAAPLASHWVKALLIGGLLFLGGNGAVSWAEQRVPSGIAALLIATEPLWIVVLDALGPRGSRVTGRTALGLAAGLLGVALLVGPGQSFGGERVDPVGAAVLVLGALSWSLGSLASRGSHHATSRTLGTAMSLLAGGGLLLVAALLSGEASRMDPSFVSPRSLLALVYLITFGSIVAFSAYTWLLSAIAVARVSTYAYVNPVVAVVLGSTLGNEPLPLRVIFAALLVVTAVAVIVGGSEAAPESEGKDEK